MLNALGRLISYLLLAVIVATAVTSLMLRLLAPMLGEYRAEIEQWVSQLVQQPISIESIDARMVGFSPQLDLVGVELLDQKRLFSVARFSELSLSFGMVSSLVAGKITLDHIDFHGLEISLIRDVNGIISVSGLGAINRGDKKREQSDEAVKMFAAWLLQQPKVSLHKSHIRWIDIGESRHLDFPDIFITLRNNGNRHTIYSLLELPEAFGTELEIDLNLTGDVFDKKSWAGELYLRGEAINSHALLKKLDLKEWKLNRGIVDGELWGEIDSSQLNRLQGRFSVRDAEVGYHDRSLALPRFDIQTLLKRESSGWQLQLSRLNFDGELRGKMPRYIEFKQEQDDWKINFDQLALSALPPFISLIRPDLLEQESEFNGYLRGVEIGYGEELNLFKAELDQIQLSGINNGSAVSGLIGRVDLNHGVATLALNSPELELKIPAFFRQSLPSLAVNGKVSASWDDGQWQLWSQQIQLQNGDLSLNVSTNLQSRTTSSEQSPHIAISADIDVLEVARLKHYIPDGVLGMKTSGWLREAFHSGEIKGGKLLIYGRGAEIVDHSRGGRMEIMISPKAVDLQFHKEWPQIKSAAADLRFSGRSMMIHSRKGETLSSGSIDDAVVKIDDFKKPLLEVDGTVHFDAVDGIKYIALSPLEAIIGKVDESTRVSGEQVLKLHLGIPLGEKKSAEVKGELQFKKVAMDFENMVKIDEIEGRLGFNQNGIERSTLKASIFDNPFELSVYQRRKGSQRSTFIETRSRFIPQKLLTNIDTPWASLIFGDTSWNAVVELNRSENRALLSMESDLIGVGSKLPHPLNKRSSEKLRSTLKYQFMGERRRQIDISVGDRLSAQLKYPKNGGALRDIHIHLGRSPLKESKMSGLFFSGKLSQLEFGRWLKLLPDSGSSSGQVGDAHSIRVDMQRLHILKRSDSNGKEDDISRSPKPATLPSIDMDVKDFEYGSMQLGTVSLKTRKAQNGLLIKHLNASDGNYRLIANGTWRNSSGTQVKLKLTADDIATMLQSLGFDNPLERGNLTAAGTLSWPGSPIDFGIEKVKGSFNLKVNDGVINDVGSDVGQLIGLFSVRKLLNRVILDFSDLKENALNYKGIVGNFRMSHGNLFTDNFSINSPQADIMMTGRTGLVKRDYDQHISVVPKISDAVPVAGTLVFGPQVAVALLALRKVFGKSIDEASMQQYRITGTWDEPEIRQIETKNVEASNQ